MHVFQNRNSDFFSDLRQYSKKSTPVLESRILGYLKNRRSLRTFTDSLYVSKDIHNPAKVNKVVGKKMANNLYAAHKCLKDPRIRIGYLEQKNSRLERKYHKIEGRLQPQSIFRRIVNKIKQYFH